MKFSEQWLREWVNPNISTDELVAQLTMAGLEVDGIEAVAGQFNAVVVGNVLETAPHPDAKKLQLCKVDVGAEQPLSIVCGAANARADIKVAVALIGAKLPNGLEIKATTIRGQDSSGMLCAESELGMAEKSDGIMELPSDAPVGEALYDYLALNDHAIEVDLTPNRGDCLSILGLAREVAVLNRTDLKSIDAAAVAVTSDRQCPVEVEDTQACPTYVGRVIEGVNSAVATPIWMQERLRRSGIRSIDAIVDITNYVMLELGQPMHAFDLDQLDGGIRVRRATEKESLTLLDGQTIEMGAESLVIADHKQALALAGVMGGEGSGIQTGKTHTLFLESAHFDPVAIAGKARSFGLHTDSSHRFERGVDFNLPQVAMERASQLILEIAGGQAGPITTVSEERGALEACLEPIDLKHQHVESLLGFSLPYDEITQILTRLGLGVEAVEGGWRVMPTSFRFDIRRDVDLIEELGRIYGYNQIPTSPTLKLEPVDSESTIDPFSEAAVPLLTIKNALVNRGFQEVITYSFVDPAWERLLAPDAQPVALANPISAEMGVMRTHLWPGLIKAAQHNLNRQQERIRMFETGLRFRLNREGAIEQEEVVAGLVTGPLLDDRWCHESRPVDFFDVKSDLMALFGLGRNEERVRFEKASHCALHPGQAASISLTDPLVTKGVDSEKATATAPEQVQVGWIGALHPSLENKLGFSTKTGKVSGKVYLFELTLNAIRKGNIPKFREVSKFPAVRRDLALIIDQDKPASELLRTIKAHSGEWLTDLMLFDLYEGDSIGTGKKSVAVSLTLQHPSRTLNDDEINHAVDRVIRVLKEELDAVLRE